MNSGLSFKRLAFQAPAVAGVVFLVALSPVSCGKKSGTPAWDTPGESAPAVIEQSAPAIQAIEPAPAVVATQVEVAVAPAPSAPSEGLRFIAYNVENWLTMDRFENFKPLKNAPKPDVGKQAVVELLADHAPDVIGVCEIGTAADLAEIQEMLKAAGLDLPHSHYTGGTDPVRHLGLLSRFPITATAKPAETEFTMNGRTFGINRGILDVSIAARGKSYRFIGVHLKSKREVDGFDQEEMRMHEGRLLRSHVDSILKEDADARLIVYGDFNDTRPSRTFKSVTGSFNDPGYLTAVPFEDSRGEAWTHYWEQHDIYSRIDFVAVTRALRQELDFHASRLIDAPEWSEASDHRALLTIFK
jgi:endonuclease/exonuclease/phosphatase family metal-dependent hydrolase